jgi:hypothetical protein
VLWTLAAVLVVPALLRPALLEPVERYWMRAAMTLGRINTRVILSVLYYVMMTPIGMVRRLFGDPLNRSLNDGRSSHWIKRSRDPIDPKSYEQQF